MQLDSFKVQRIPLCELLLIFLDLILDVWSIGVTLYRMLYGGFPWSNIQSIVDGDFLIPDSASKGTIGFRSFFFLQFHL